MGNTGDIVKGNYIPANYFYPILTEELNRHRDVAIPVVPSYDAFDLPTPHYAFGVSFDCGAEFIKNLDTDAWIKFRENFVQEFVSLPPFKHKMADVHHFTSYEDRGGRHFLLFCQ